MESKQKALVSFLVCTGARLGETVQVRLSGIYRDEKPVRVEFPARKTKTQNKRHSFLSSECVQLVKTHIVDQDRIRKSELGGEVARDAGHITVVLCWKGLESMTDEYVHLQRYTRTTDPKSLQKSRRNL